MEVKKRTELLLVILALCCFFGLALKSLRIDKPRPPDPRFANTMISGQVTEET